MLVFGFSFLDRINRIEIAASLAALAPRKDVSGKGEEGKVFLVLDVE